MKRLSIALAATTLLALAGCGSRTVNNAAAVDTSNDVYNVSPDDLTLNDLGNASDNGASMSGNASSSSATGNSAAGGTSSRGHASNSSATHTAGNSH